ncbi:unnamed protein product [Closterium sp. NIES-54]
MSSVTKRPSIHVPPLLASPSLAPSSTSAVSAADTDPTAHNHPPTSSADISAPLACVRERAGGVEELAERENKTGARERSEEGRGGETRKGDGEPWGNEVAETMDRAVAGSVDGAVAALPAVESVAGDARGAASGEGGGREQRLQAGKVEGGGTSGAIFLDGTMTCYSNRRLENVSPHSTPSSSHSHVSHPTCHVSRARGAGIRGRARAGAADAGLHPSLASPAAARPILLRPAHAWHHRRLPPPALPQVVQDVASGSVPVCSAGMPFLPEGTALVGVTPPSPPQVRDTRHTGDSMQSAPLHNTPRPCLPAPLRPCLPAPLPPCFPAPCPPAPPAPCLPDPPPPCLPAPLPPFPPVPLPPCPLASVPPLLWHAIPDLSPFPELHWLDSYNFVPPLSLAVLLWGTGGIAAFGWGFCVATVVCWHFTYCINSLAHLVGSRRFRCEFNTHCDARNNLALALATLGEGWHNNHHCYMRSAKHGFYPEEIDITWYILCCLERLGLVWDLHLPPLDELEASWFDNRHLQCRCHSAEKDMRDTISSSTLLAADMCAGTDVLVGGAGAHGKNTADWCSRPCSHMEADQDQGDSTSMWRKDLKWDNDSIDHRSSSSSSGGGDCGAREGGDDAASELLTAAAGGMAASDSVAWQQGQRVMVKGERW